MPATAELLKTSFTRVFTIEGSAGPGNVPRYQGFGMVGGNNNPFGDVTPVRVPSAKQYDVFDTVDTIKGQRGLPSNSIDNLSGRALSALWLLADKGCDFDVQVHAGSCGTPDDFNGGWADGVVRVWEKASVTNFTEDALGALDGDARAVVHEGLDFTARRYYQISPVNGTSQADTLISDEVVDVVIPDAATCGACGVPSDGANIVVALVGESSGSPGIAASVVYTKDAGSTWTKGIIQSMGLAETARRMAQVGPYLVVTVGGATGGLHYIKTVDLLGGAGVWTKVATGFTLASGAPNAIYSASAAETWIAGDGGYIYFTSDPTAGVTQVQQAGGLTAQNLNGIQGYGNKRLVAVGASNVVLQTANGGTTWTLVTGPAVGVALNTVALRSNTNWLVGTAGGALYYTVDSGTTWTAKAFSGSGAGQVRHVVFANGSVGYMAHDTAALVGRVFRTIDGGYSWYLVPEAAGTFPTNRKINRIAVPDSSGPNAASNLAYAGGLLDANDGILVRVA